MFNYIKFFILIKIKCNFKINDSRMHLPAVMYDSFKLINYLFLLNPLKCDYNYIFEYSNLSFFFKKNFKYYTSFNYMDQQAYSFTFNYRTKFFKKYKLLQNVNLKLKFLLSLKYLLYLCEGLKQNNDIKIFLTFKKLNFLFFNFSFLFVKFFYTFCNDGIFMVEFDRLNNKYYFKKKRSIKKNRLKKIKLKIRNIKNKYNDTIINFI